MDHQLKRLAIWIGVGITGAWILSAVFVYWLTWDWETRGQIGDMFGAVNALFSGLAFAGVIIAIVLQRNELTLQREELRLTREQVAKQAEAQEASSMMLGVTARLNALSALLEYGRDRALGDPNRVPRIVEEIDIILKQLKQDT